MENNLEVIERLTRIEQKLDDYKEVKDLSRDADSRSKQNEKRILELEDRNKWLGRTMVGAIVCEIVGLGFLILKFGLGV